MDSITHTILALGWSMIIAVVFYYRGRAQTTMIALEMMLENLEENGFIKTKVNRTGEKELIKIDD